MGFFGAEQRWTHALRNCETNAGLPRGRGAAAIWQCRNSIHSTYFRKKQSRESQTVAIRNGNVQPA